tara:strand:- start:348 stop:452 length:105 start_codon:yes stop_codon:yes gene_type:complete
MKGRELSMIEGERAEAAHEEERAKHERELCMRDS